MVRAERPFTYRQRAFVASFGVAITALFQKFERLFSQLVSVSGQFVPALCRTSAFAKQSTKPTLAHDLRRLPYDTAQ